jgi:putative membrane protein
MKLIISLFVSIVLLSCNGNADNKETTDTTLINQSANRGSGDAPADTANTTIGNDTDMEFALKVSMGNTAEIEAGQLAANKAAAATVKEFGNMMVKDHGEAQAKLKNIASSLSFKTPDSADADHKKMKTTLEGLSGKTFDKAYIDGQVEDHIATVALFEKEISIGSNAQLKAFASSTLIHIKMHLEKAQQLQSTFK